MRLTGDRLKLSRSAGAVNPIRLVIYLSLIFGEGLSKAGTISMLPVFGIPLLERIPYL